MKYPRVAERLPLIIRAVPALILFLPVFVFWGCGGASQTSPPTAPTPAPSGTLQISSLSETTARPFDLLTISGSGFDSTAMISFSSAPIGFSGKIQPVVVSQTSLVVSVPVLLSGATFSSGAASVTVVQSAGQSNSMQLLIGGVPPAPPNAPGTVTLSFLQAELAIANQLSSQVTPPPLPSDLTALISALNSVIPPIQAVVNGTASSANLGTFKGQPMILGATELARMDQLFLALLQSLANSNASGFSTTVSALSVRVENAVIEKAAQLATTSACMSASAVENTTFDIATRGTASNVAADLIYLGQTVGTSPDAGKLVSEASELAVPALLLAEGVGLITVGPELLMAATVYEGLSDLIKIDAYMRNPKPTGADKAEQLLILISNLDLGLGGDIFTFGVSVGNLQRDLPNVPQGPPAPRAAACVSALSLDFGAVNMGSTSGPKLVKLTNTGPVGLTVTLPLFVGGPDPADFHQTNDCPAALNASASCTITVTFSPSKNTEHAAIGINGTSPALPIVIDLSGIGQITTGTDFTGTWTGTWKWSGTGSNGCTNFSDGGSFSMTLVQTGTAFSGSTTAEGIQDRDNATCTLISTQSGAGQASGTISGSKNLSFDLSDSSVP